LCCSLEKGIKNKSGRDLSTTTQRGLLVLTFGMVAQ
jgi:hypothetical protein